MPDLSNLLGAVYGDGPSKPTHEAEDEAHVEHEPAADERTPAVPDWSDDEHLDAAFAQWKPGPSEDASPAEHAFVLDADDDPGPPLADDLAAALSEALVAASGAPDDSDEDATETRHFDFSDGADEDAETEVDREPLAAFAPHDVDDPADLSKSEIERHEQAGPEQSRELGEVEAIDPEPEPEPEPVHEIHRHDAEPEPEPEPEPVPEIHLHDDPPDLSKFEIERHEQAGPEQSRELGEVEAIDRVHDAEPGSEPVRERSMTSERAAAAELTAASRIDRQSVVETPTPVATPEPAPVPAGSMPVPTAVVSKPAPVPAMSDGSEAPTTLLGGMHRWERSDDDILPEKQAKKLFSFSLRRG